ncbi:acyl carrier protein [Labedaea rhizosphaerae]|uniref:Acyl carrier protein n=1 Tax=Labedaea rhizosphaerae TaxID=598644 RepID=A0A4R6RUG5_LABRH|nr:acyl carrier protein [Labedaea rhizosphaerae]TDP90591.1 acyl carrier protein [Labedaea rhizosphaerae]
MTTPSLDSVHADLLDCVQANLAVLADHHHGPGTHLNLGATLRFRWHSEPNELPTVEPSLAEQVAAAEDLLGLVVRDRATVTGAELVDAVRPGDLVYVVADAYELPWVPYFGQRHLDHSFLLGADFTVIDAYANETPWGTAAPGRWKLTRDQLAVREAEVIHFGGASAGPARPVVSVEDASVEGYLAAYDADPDRLRALERLTLETWLLARSRKLHARFREHDGFPPDAEQRAHLGRWDALVEQTYLAFRRVARGRGEPAGLVRRLGEMLDADRAVFGELVSPGGKPSTVHNGPCTTEALRRAVASVVGSVLGVPDARLLDGAEFTSLPRFSSFRLVEIIERLEGELGVELDPADLVPENLHRVDDLCRIAQGRER